MDVTGIKTTGKIVEILNRLNLNDGYGDSWKGTGTDKDTLHSYAEVYEDLLSVYDDKSISFLEVGVQFGGSFLLWQELLPKASFTLLDIHDSRCKEAIENAKEGTDFILSDAYVDSTVENLREKYPEGFDVIVEDGPHTPETQAYFVKNYLPLLKKGGVMVIEDLAADWWVENLFREVPDDLKNNVYVHDHRRVKGRWDDILFVIKK